MSRVITTTRWATGLLIALGLPVTVATAFFDVNGERERQVLAQQLPVGESHHFYRKKLVTLGYTITAVTYDAPADYAGYRVSKNGRTYEVHLNLDGGSDRANQVAVTGESTTRG